MGFFAGPFGLERRGAERFRVYAGLSVIRPHDMTTCRARLVNISDRGAAIAPDQPLAYGSRVFLWIPRFRLSGAARVCRCFAQSSHYFAALEFEEPLRLNAPPAAET